MFQLLAAVKLSMESVGAELFVVSELRAAEVHWLLPGTRSCESVCAVGDLLREAYVDSNEDVSCCTTPRWSADTCTSIPDVDKFAGNTTKSFGKEIGKPGDGLVDLRPLTSELVTLVDH